MANKTQYGRQAQLSYTASKWMSDYSNVVLYKGEIGIETDTRKIKIGDGSTTWENLLYENPDYTLPIATDSVLGGIKSSTGVGAVTVDSSTGTASVSEVAKAQKLSEAAEIALTGDVSGSADFDGSADISITVTASDATTTTHGFMSASDKTKLNGISDGANKVESSVTNGNIKIDNVETTVYELPTADTSAIGGIKSSSTAGDVKVNTSGIATIDDVVASEGGIGGSHGLMISVQAEKLAGIATGAQVNVLEGLQIKYSRDSAYSDVPIDSNKKSQLDFSNYPTFDDISSALNFRGDLTGDELAALTISNVNSGDVYHCTQDDSGEPVTFHVNMEYAAVISGEVGSEVLSWTELGDWVDLSGYVQKTQTINNKALSNNIVLDGSDIALTGYTEASSAAAIATTDTINEGIGKLEYKIDVLNGTDSTTGSVAKSVKDAVEALDYTDSVTGDYVTSVNEVNGVISITKGTKGTVSSGEGSLVDGGTVYNAIDGAVTIDSVTVNGTAATLTDKTLPFAEGTTNGTVKVAGTDVAVHGLGSNAYTNTAYVPEARTINGEGLDSDITLDGADIALTGYTEASTIADIAATDTINEAIGKLEFRIDSASTGTVTSVGLSMPNTLFTVSGSPVTTNGTLEATLNNQSANTVLAGPNGSTGAPSFRSLVADDIPTVQSSKVQLTGATADNLPKLDSNGSYVDSGVAVDDVITVNDTVYFCCTLD